MLRRLLLHLLVRADFVPLWIRSGHLGSGCATTAARAPEQTSRSLARPATPSTTFFLRFLAASLCRIPGTSTTRAARTAPNQWRKCNEHQDHRRRAPDQGSRASEDHIRQVSHSLDLAHNFRERVGKDFKDVATTFFSASVWEEDGAVEVAELGLTKGSRVSVDGLWSKRTWTTKEGERRVTDVLTVSKVRLFTETEVARPEAVGDDAEPTPDEAIGQPAA